MWLLGTKCDLNILAEFLKFDILKLQPGVITEECLKTVLEAENISEEIIDKKLENFR